MECVFCKGTKEIEVFHRTFVDGTGAFGGTLECPFCEGVGTISEHYWEWKKIGEEMKKERLARGVTCRKESIRRGMMPSTLSRMELGLEKPDPIYSPTAESI